VMAMMCRAWLSWRSPPRSSRWRWRCPEEQGIGAVPVWRAKLASLENRWAPAVRAISSAAVRAPQPVSASSWGRCADQHQQLALERIHSAREVTQLRDLLARDPNPGARGQGTQPSLHSIKLAWMRERAAAERALEFGAELKQMPAQPILHAGAFADEILAVIRQQRIHRSRIQVGGGEALHAVPGHRRGDRERVDLVRLARLELPPPGGPIRCGATGTTCSPAAISALLERARDVPTVLSSAQSPARSPPTRTRPAS
jgi:hypothetical protein